MNSAWKNKLLGYSIVFIVFLVILEISAVIFYPFLSNDEFSRDRILQKLNEKSELLDNQNDTLQGKIKNNYTRSEYKKIILHPYLGFIESPDDHHSFYGSDVNYETELTGKINEFGFEGPAIIPKKNPKKINICLLGGSFSMYFYHETRQKFIEELKKYPFFANKEIEIYSYATSGYKEPQQLMALNYFLSMGGEYDIVINLDGINDIAIPVKENMPYQLFPFFPRFWYVFSNRVSSAESNLIYADISQNKIKKNSYMSLFNHFPLNFSNASLMLWELLDKKLEFKISSGYQMYVKSVFNSMESKNIENCGPSFDYGLDRDHKYKILASYWKQCSKMMQSLAIPFGFEYFHFLQPNQHVAGSKPFTEVEKMFIVTYPNDPDFFGNIATEGYPHLIRTGKELKNEGVQFEDLTMVFKDTKETIYRDPCCHINKNGNEIMAKKMAERISIRMKYAK